jgi:1-acyl-sn-glycerol-3-phosphate acyltransferase
MAEADEQRDVGELADALLAAVQAGVEPEVGDESSEFAAALEAFRHRAIEFVRRYNRLEIDLETASLTEQVLFVANHGFGGAADLNLLAISAALEDLHLDRPVTFLAHQIAWTLGAGPIVERLGLRPASHENAHEAFAQGHHVVVFPGGDLDANKFFAHRNEIVFGGRTGFARLAIDQQVPIVPIVTAGGGESVLVLSDGHRLARALKLDKLLRVKAIPITASLPWGINVGAVGMLPYLPLPTKLHTRVLAGMTAQPDEESADYAERVRITMQDALTAMTAHRKPILG